MDGAEKLEKKYIALLEGKISSLEKELAEKSKTDSKKAPQENTKGTSTSNGIKDGETPAVKKKSRVRYLIRSYTETGEFTTQPCEEDPGKDGALSNEDSDELAISWRHTYEEQNGNGEKKRKFSFKELVIESTGLKKALEEVVTKKYKDMSFNRSETSLRRPFECIYHCQKELQAYADQQTGILKDDIHLLVNEVLKEMKEEIEDAKALAKKKQITFDLLWTLFYPGAHVYCQPIMNQPQIFLTNGVYIPNFDAETLEFLLEKDALRDALLWGFCMDYDGKNFHPMDVEFKLERFKNVRQITSLPVYPVEWHQDSTVDSADLRKKLIDRGRKFEQFCTATRGHQFFQYKGSIIDEGQDYLLVDREEKIGDSETTSYDGSTAERKRRSPRKVHTIKELPSGSHVMVDAEAFFTYGDKECKVGELIARRPMDCKCVWCMAWEDEHKDLKSDTKKPLTEDLLLICLPRVLGFALKQKIWIQMLVDNIEDLPKDGRNRAWEKLVLPKKTKELLGHLVEQHTRSSDHRVNDLIPGKGNGLIALLHGPPGVGKTLTAESLAVRTGKPLYSISMSDVGLSQSRLETNLLRIFDLGVRWGAILLFDEADVFLESRSLNHLHRNGLVSMLLRVLEYYQGILFLTTNRIKTFDEAFQSRVHIAIRYEEFNSVQRRAIWSMWLNQLSEGLAESSDGCGFLDEVMDEPFNGRQIRNIITSAQAVTKGKSKLDTANLLDINSVAKVTKAFQVYLNHSSELARQQGVR